MEVSLTGTNGHAKDAHIREASCSMSEAKTVNDASFTDLPTPTSGRSRRKAIPRKLIFEEEPTSDGMSTPSSSSQQATLASALATVTTTASSSVNTNTATSSSPPSSSSAIRMTADEILLNLQSMLGGKVDMQQVLAQILTAEPTPIAFSGSYPNNSECLDSTSAFEAFQQQIAVAAQHQLAALASVPPFTPMTPKDSGIRPSKSGRATSRPAPSSNNPFDDVLNLCLQLSSSSTDSPSSSSSTPRTPSLPSRAQKRRLFDSTMTQTNKKRKYRKKFSLPGISTASPSSTLRGTSLENMTRDERIEVEDLEQFAATFKRQRIKFGFTQGDVGQALGKRYGTDFSQTTISRFEAMNLSFKNMCKLRPLLKEWLADAEKALANGATLSDLIESSPSTSTTQPPTVVVSVPPAQDQVDREDAEASAAVVASIAASCQDPAAALLRLTTPSPFFAPSAPLKKRRKRTNLDNSQRQLLDMIFKLNPRPSHDQMSNLADQLKLERDVVRVWFCNRRQKMRKVDDPLPVLASTLEPALVQMLLSNAAATSSSPSRAFSESPGLDGEDADTAETTEASTDGV